MDSRCNDRHRHRADRGGIGSSRPPATFRTRAFRRRRTERMGNPSAPALRQHVRLRSRLALCRLCRCFVTGDRRLFFPRSLACPFRGRFLGAFHGFLGHAGFGLRHRQLCARVTIPRALVVDEPSPRPTLCNLSHRSFTAPRCAAADSPPVSSTRQSYARSFHRPASAGTMLPSRPRSHRFARRVSAEDQTLPTPHDRRAPHES